MQSKPRRSADNNFITLLNFIADPAIIVDGKGRFLVVNDAFMDLTGLRKKELIGTAFLDLSVLTAENKAILFKNLEKRIKGVHVEPYEISFTNQTGETRYAEVKAKKIDYAGHPADLVIFHDITRRKESARRLKEYSEKMEALVNEKVKEIEESEEKYRELINGMNDTAWVIDLDANFVDVNDAAVRVLGYSRDELLSMGPQDIDNSLTKEQILDLIRNMPADQTQVFETSHTTKNGKTIPVEISSSLVTYQRKQAILSIARDITERKQMEMKLREAEKRYHALFDKAPLGILLIDPETATAVEFNEEAHRQLGYTREEFAKLAVSDYEVLETPRETRARMKKVLREGRDEFETKHRAKNGEIRDVINTVQVSELFGKKFFHLITRDVTEQKKIEHELEMERDNLEAVTENIGAGLAIISKDYRILWANKLLKQINGDCEGKMCYLTFNRLTDVCPECGVKKVFENGVPIDTHEYSNQDDKGNRFWIELIVTPIKDEKGNVIAALELAVNTTERKIMQNKLAEYSQKLEKLVEKRTKQLKQTQAKLVKSERLAAIGELAAMVGHDLRNPLTGIMGAAYYLKTKHGAELGAKGKEMLETLEKAINYSNKVVNDLVEYSRDLKLKLTETTPKALLKNALALLEVPEKIQIVDATEGELTVKADTEKMQRVFVNIIRNAVDAMAEGGTLTIKSREVKGKLEIVFKDTGTGMSKETLSKLERGVPLFTTKAKGMGFGLPICRRLAEAHGGKISVESTAGKETTVTVTIPVKPKSLSEGEEKWIFNESMLSATLATQRNAMNTKG
jgi:PAS domain S-box-containing protein